MSKKEFQSELAKTYNKKSDTELIDIIATIGSPTIRPDTAKAILDKRTKRVLQYLTEMVRKNNKVTERYNKIMAVLTFVIIILTFAMTFATFKMLGYAKIQSRPAIEQSTRNKENALITCQNNPDGEVKDIHGNPIECSEVLKMLDK